MITAFFKPKSSRKVTPAEGPTLDSTSKRSLEEHDAENVEVSAKRLKSTSSEPKSDAVKELLSYLKNDPERDDGDKTTWTDVLNKHSKTASFTKLAEFVASQR